MNVDQIVAELKTATGWQNIAFKDQSFVFDLDIQDIRVVKGLKQGNDSLYLDFDSFAELPISFFVQVGDIVHQYWTRGKHLHRGDGRPSYVAFDPGNERIIRRWHWHGMLHRIDGPAKEMIKGFHIDKVELEGMDHVARESWKHMQLEWYREGLPAEYPCVRRVKLEEGHRFRNRRSNQIDSPRSDLAAFYTERMEAEWSVTKSDAFHPVSGEFLDLTERYDDGKFVDRDCSMIDIAWARGDSVIEHKEVTHFNEELRDGELLSLLNLWGDFYTAGDTEFLLLTEFDRIGRDEGVA